MAAFDGGGSFARGGLFRSGFESPVGLIGPSKSPSGNWIGALAGADLGFDWPSDLPGQDARSGFYFLIDGAHDVGSIVDTRLDLATGPTGAESRVLYQAVLKDHKSLHSRARNMFSVFNGAVDEMSQGYVRYFIRLQPNLEAVMPQGAWRQIIEWREANDAYRMALNVMRDASTGRLFWTVHGDFAGWTRDWEIENHAIPVPAGQWFLLEAYWEHATTDGRLLIKVNCQTIADHHGRTRAQGPLDHLHLFKVYASAESLAAGRAEQWIDDVELGTELTSANCP